MTLPQTAFTLPLCEHFVLALREADPKGLCETRRPPNLPHFCKAEPAPRWTEGVGCGVMG